MDMQTFNDFLSGATCAGYAVAALFFVRFYARVGDRLFVMFAAALLLLGGLRAATVMLEDPMEYHYLYWLRFAAYLLILAAIIDKNLPRGSKADLSAQAS
jgi:hypothetical protein